MVRFIIILIIGVLALSYFGISIQNIVESPTGTDNFTYVWNFIKDGWHLIVGGIAAFFEAIRGVFT